MSRLITAGFETGSIQELNGASQSATASTTYARTGTYSLALNCTTLGTADYLGHVFDADETELYWRIAVLLPADAMYDHELLVLNDSNGDEQITLWFDGDTQGLQLRQSTDVRATGTAVLRAGIWYVLQGHVTIDDSGAYEVKVNNVTDIDYSGDTQATAVAGARSFRIQAGNSSEGAPSIYIDDIAVNNADGSYQNTWIGLGGIYLLKPDAEGTTQDWTPSAGTVHWSTVDDTPANTTDWVQSDVSGSEYELFNIESAPEYVTSIDTVNVIYQVAVVESGDQAIEDVVRQGTVNYPGGGTVTVVSIAPAWVLYQGTTHYVQPNGAGAWGTVEIESLEIGVITGA